MIFSNQSKSAKQQRSLAVLGFFCFHPIWLNADVTRAQNYRHRPIEVSLNWIPLRSFFPPQLTACRNVSRNTFLHRELILFTDRLPLTVVVSLKIIPPDLTPD